MWTRSLTVVMTIVGLVTASARNESALFPPQVAAFRREGPVSKDAGGFPQATYWAGRMILLSAFYYKDNAFATEYANCRGYVKQAHPQAQLLSDGPSSLHPGGRRAVFTFEDKFGGGSKVKLQSELLMFPHRDRYFAFRVTYPVAHKDRARQEIDAFVRALQFP